MRRVEAGCMLRPVNGLSAGCQGLAFGLAVGAQFTRVLRDYLPDTVGLGWA